MTKKKKKSKPDHHLSENEKRLLKGLCTNLNSPAAFGSIKNLQKASGLSIHKVRKLLRTSKTYTKFKKAVRKLKRRSLYVNIYERFKAGQLGVDIRMKKFLMTLRPVSNPGPVA